MSKKEYRKEDTIDLNEDKQVKDHFFNDYETYKEDEEDYKFNKWKILFWLLVAFLFIYWLFFTNKSYSIEDYRQINREKWQHSLEISKKQLIELRQEFYRIKEQIQLANRCIELNSQVALAFDCEYKTNE